MNKTTKEKMINKSKNNIKCECGIFFKAKAFKKHFKNCNLFIKKYIKFDYKISRLLGEYLLNKENLTLVRFLMKRYVKLIEKKIIENNKEKNNKNNINEYNIINQKENNIYEKPGNEKEKYLKNNYNGKSIYFTPYGNTPDGDAPQPPENTNIFGDFINVDIENINNNDSKAQTSTPTTTTTPGMDINDMNHNNNSQKKSNDNNDNKKNIDNTKNNTNNNNTNNNKNNNENNSVIDNILDLGKNYLSLFLNSNIRSDHLNK